MRLNMNFLKEYYERLDEEQKEEHDITDFGYGVYYDDLIIEEDD